MKDVTLKFIKSMGITSEGDIFQLFPKKNPKLTSPVKRVDQSPLEMTRSSKKLPYCPVMCDTLRRRAATKRTCHHFQQGYEFCDDVYVDGLSFQWTSLQSGLHICHFCFHYERSTRSLPVCDLSCVT
ncbi:hypothetical protein TNCV_2568111 [Trichonephila clavipes]|uniref:Uncharacterized protein n=1 Tax=Trichonephila clavipes TaxID=2585209 RepID=A0A8X6WKT2_TRICX|nr:hypothetical protein TNCV_2568111 [Trichonephila clavipes]